MRTTLNLGTRADILRCQASRSVAVGYSGQCEHPAKGEAPMYDYADGTTRNRPACGVHIRMHAMGARSLSVAA